MSAVQWPATAACLAGMVLLSSDSGHAARGLVLVLAAALGELVWAARRGEQLRVDLVVVAAGALAATTALALFATLGGATAADAVRSAFRWIGLATGLLVLPIQLFLIGRGATRSAVVLGFAVAVVLALAVVEQAIPSIASSPLSNLGLSGEAGRAAGSFASPNRLGTVAGMALVVAGVAISIVWPRRGPTIVLAVFGVLAATALLLTFSRAAILGVLAASIVLVALRSPRAALAAVAIAVALGLILTPLLISARLASDAGSRVERLAADDAQRVTAWRFGLSMFASAPLTGHGYGSFAWTAAAEPGVGALETAHNEVIALLAEAGITAAAAYLLMFAMIIIRGLRPVPVARIGLGAALVFLVATMFNVQSVFPEVTVVLWTAVAYGIAAGERPWPARVSS